jgi:hypothetical protein
MNEHANSLRRLDSELSENARKQRALWSDFSKYGEYGDLELTRAGKRRMRELVAEREGLEASANAMYSIRT